MLRFFNRNILFTHFKTTCKMNEKNHNNFKTFFRLNCFYKASNWVIIGNNFQIFEKKISGLSWNPEYPKLQEIGLQMWMGYSLHTFAGLALIVLFTFPSQESAFQRKRENITDRSTDRETCVIGDFALMSYYSHFFVCWFCTLTQKK